MFPAGGLQGDVLKSAGGKREIQALALVKGHTALNWSRRGREMEVPRYPEGLSVWFGKTQGRIYIRIPRPGCFHVACSLGFTVLKPGEILLEMLPSGTSPVRHLHPRRGAAGMRVLKRAQSTRETVSNYLYLFMHESDVNYQVSFPKPFLKLQQP